MLKVILGVEECSIVVRSNVAWLGLMGRGTDERCVVGRKDVAS